MAKKQIELQVYIDNLNAGVPEGDIIKAAVSSGVTEKEVKEKIKEAKAAIEKVNDTTEPVTGVTDEDAALKSKTNELLSNLENSLKSASELREIRRKNKLSDIGIANIGREITQLIKVTKRYAEN